MANYRVRKLLIVYIVYTRKISKNKKKYKLEYYCFRSTTIEQKLLGVC